MHIYWNESVFFSADLIMLGLATHEPYFTILREEFKPNTPRPCEICNQIGNDKHSRFLSIGNFRQQGKWRKLIVINWFIPCSNMYMYVWPCAKKMMKITQTWNIPKQIVFYMNLWYIVTKMNGITQVLIFCCCLLSSGHSMKECTGEVRVKQGKVNDPITYLLVALLPTHVPVCTADNIHVCMKLLSMMIMLLKVYCVYTLYMCMCLCVYALLIFFPHFLSMMNWILVILEHRKILFLSEYLFWEKSVDHK